MNTNPNETICPKCGNPVSLNAFEGLCPQCLMQAGFGTVTNGPGSDKLSAFVPPTPEELARHFPQLEILELLGRGGMGAVYKARQTHLDRIVALKILPPSVSHAPSFAERFVREAKALAKLHHPNIVTLYESGQADDLFYFLMEFVDGVNLRQLLATGTISPKDALTIVPQICDALQFAHDRGIVHRDIKPENILLSKNGQVKIADFGVAKLVVGESAEAPSSVIAPTEISETEVGKVIGTPQYMAPEQLSHPLDVDNRADIYALGVVFYQMLTGELPAGKFEPPSRKVQIDVRLDEVVLRALEKKPELRYQQVNAMKTQVETIAQTPPPKKKPAVAARTMSGPALGNEILTHLTPVEKVKIEKNKTRLLLLFFAPAFLLALLTIYSDPADGTTNLLRDLLGALWPPIILLTLWKNCSVLCSTEWAKQQGIRPSQFWFPIFKRGGRESEAGAEFPPRFSRTAIVGASFVGCSLITFIWFSILSGESLPPWESMDHPERLGFVLTELIGLTGWLSVFAAPILGWIAVSQIRRSAGKLCGMGLSVFAGLFFPLLLLDALIVSFQLYFNVQKGGNGLVIHVLNATPFELLGLLAIGYLDWFIIRRVWRAVNEPVNGLPMPPAGSARNSPGMPALAVCAFCMAGLSGLLGAVAFCIMPNSSPVLDGAIPLAALIGISLGMGTSRIALGKAAIFVGGINLAICLFVQALTVHLQSATPASAQFHYRVFVDDAAFVDNLIPVAQRQNGVMQNVRPSVFKSQVSTASSNGIFLKTDSQLAVVSPEILNSLVGGMAAKPGLLVDKTEVIPPWPDPPGIAYGKGFSFTDHEIYAHGSVSGFLKASSTNGVLQARIEDHVEFSENNLPGLVQSAILYDGNPLQPGALAFLIPFQSNDGSTYYLVVAYEITGSTDGAASTGSAPNVHFFRIAAIIFVALSATALLAFFVARAIWPTANSASDSKPLQPAATPTPTGERPWLLYGGALLKILPLVLSWGFCFVFLVPKLRQLFVDRASGQVADAAPFLKFVFQVFGPGVPTLIFFFFLAFALVEWLLPVWRRHRRTLLFIVTMSVNALALASLLSLGVMASILASENTYPVSGAIDPVKNFAFGPVIEREVPNDSVIAFKDGNVSGLPNEVTNDNGDVNEGISRVVTWMEQHGDDAQAKADSLTGFGAIVFPLEAGQWELITLGTLQSQLDQQQSVPEVKMDGSKKLPATYGFKTRQGSMGVLQITGLIKEGGGVKIRYKLAAQPSTMALKAEVWLAEVPADFKPTAESMERDELVRRVPGVKLFSAPTVITRCGIEATIETSPDPPAAPGSGLATPSTAVTIKPEWTGSNVHFSLKVSAMESNTPDSTNTQQVTLAGTAELGALAVFDLGPIDGGRRRVGAIRFSKPDADNPDSQKPYSSPPSQNPSSTFGPAIERTIEKSDPAHRALNLASGNFMTPSRGRDFVLSPEGADGLREAGVDLYVSDDAQAPDNINTLDMRAWLSIEPGAPDAPPIDLDKITVEEFNQSLPRADRIRSDFENHQPLKTAGIDLKKVEPILRGKSAFVFETRDGTKGVLQIGGLSDNPSGVKIRYKLLQVGTVGSSQPINQALQPHK